MSLVFRLIAEVGDDVGNGNRFADARCLDDDVVVLARVRDVGQLVCQVIGKRAAQTSIREWNEVAIHLGEPVRIDQRRIDVHLADVVHDDRSADAFLVCEDVVQKGGLACSEVSSEQDDFNRLLFFHEALLCSRLVCFSLLPTTLLQRHTSRGHLHAKPPVIEQKLWLSRSACRMRDGPCRAAIQCRDET